LAASVPMAVGIWLVRNEHLFIQMIVGIAVYVVALYLFKGYDRQLLRELISSRSGSPSDSNIPTP